jgi:hypothetical protein
MGCCGRQRSQIQGTAPSRVQGAAPAHHVIERPAAAPVAPPARRSTAYFRYLGKTGLTVVGPITGKRYRFDKPGDVVAVDLRDRRSIAGVPNLREVSQPFES